MNIFISHITEESSIAQVLKEFIETKYRPRQISVFASSNVHDLTPGQPWLDKIMDELQKCDVVLLI